MNKQCIWSFYWDCGRMGDLSGLFAATKDEVQSAIGKHINFGEVLGKHSEIYGTLKDNDFTCIEIDQKTIDKISEVIGSSTWSGYNPLEFLDEEF